MTFPTVAGTNTSTETGNVSSHTVNLPASISAGETLLGFFSCDAAETITWPGGWNVIASDQQSHTGEVAWKKATGSEGGSITVTTGTNERSAHQVHRITGAADPAVTPPQAVTPVTAVSDSPNPGDLTPTGGAKDYLWYAVATWNGDMTVSGIPANYSNELTVVEGSVSGSGVSTARRELNASSEDPGVFTLSTSTGWMATTVAVHPAAAAGANPKGPLGMPLRGPFGGPI